MAPFTWVFPGAFPVVAAAGLVVSAAIYQCVRNVARSPDFRWNDELKTDALAESPKLLERAAAYHPSVFRKIGETRTVDKHTTEADCRVFRFWPFAAGTLVSDRDRFGGRD
jgi:hypothetical protein